MKRSIKAATLTFFVTSLLAGCSSEGPAPVAQEITVSPESKVTTKDKSFTLETNASSATWSLEEDHCQAVLSATEGKSVTVSAGTVGKVTVVASASGYTTPKVTLTFNPQVQEITASSTEVYLDESISLTTNLSSANWALEDNNIGAVLSAQSGKSVSVSATSAGTVKAVATAQDSTTASLLLKFDALLPQTLSASPVSAEVFKGKTISVSTSISSANWSLSENTCGAVFTTSTTGKTVEVKADSVGTVVLTSKLAHYEDASITLSFVDPHWTDDEKALMSAALHGEVLPYPQGAGDIYSGSDGGVFFAYSGDAIEASVLSDYAKNFSSEEGWVKVPVYASQPSVELYYIFEKEIKVEIEGVEERRFAHVEFLSLNPSSGSIVENGIFYLEASDPYIYSKDEVTALFTDAKKDLGIESELDVPVLSAHHYSFFVPSSNKYASSSWYEVELGEAESAVELYKSTLAATEDYDIYADSVEGGYVAEEKNGAFSIILVGNGVNGVDVTLKKGRHYVSEWPSKEVAALVASYESETAVPAFESAARYSFEEFTGNSDEKILAVYCHGIESEEPFAGYPALLEGWTLFGELFDGYYVADSADGKIGVQFSFSAGTLSIYISENTFEHEFPSDVFEYAKMIYGIDSEYGVPALPAGGYYPFAEIKEDSKGEQYLLAGVECYLVENSSADEDGGYGKILAEAGWLVSGAIDVYDDETHEYLYSYFAADAPDQLFGVQWTYDSANGVAQIFFSEEPYFYYAWPDELVEYITDAAFYSEDYIPSIEADYYEFDWNYFVLSCYGVEPVEETDDAGYSALLTSAGFTVSEYTEVDESGAVTHFAFSPLSEYEERYMVYYSYSNGVLSIGFNYGTEMSYISSAWSSDAIEEVFFINGYSSTSYEVPEMAAADAEFITTTYVLDYGFMQIPYSADVYVFGATGEEIEAYLEKIASEGWEIAEESTSASGSAKKVIEDYNKIATISWGIQEATETSEEFFYFSANFFLSEIPSAEFPVEAVSAFFEENGVDVPEANIPEYKGENLEFESDDSYEGYYDVYVTGSDAAGMDDYKDALVSLGWVVVGEEEGDYRLQFGETAAYVDLLNYGDYIDVSFFVEEATTPKSVAEKVALYLGATATEEEDEDGTYWYILAYYAASESETVASNCAFLENLFGNLYPDFTFDGTEGGEWIDDDGAKLGYFVSEDGIVCEVYVYEQEDSEEGTSYICIEFYSYYDAE